MPWVVQPLIALYLARAHMFNLKLRRLLAVTFIMGTIAITYLDWDYHRSKKE